MEKTENTETSTKEIVGEKEKLSSIFSTEKLLTTHFSPSKLVSSLDGTKLF